MYTELRLSEITERAWIVAKKHGLFVLLVLFLNNMASNLVSQSINMDRFTEMMTELENTGDMQRALEVFNKFNVTEHLGLSIIIAIVLSIIINMFLNLVSYKLLWKGVSDYDSKADLSSAIKSSANNNVWKYICIEILWSLTLGLSAVFCILPMFFVLVRLLFVKIIAANHPELSISEAFSRSWNITKGHFWELLGYGITTVFINFVGFCCCCIGVLFTTVYTQFMLAECYYRLSETTSPAEQPAVQTEDSGYQKNY